MSLHVVPASVPKSFRQPCFKPRSSSDAAKVVDKMTRHPHPRVLVRMAEDYVYSPGNAQPQKFCSCRTWSFCTKVCVRNHDCAGSSATPEHMRTQAFGVRRTSAGFPFTLVTR